jgi:hypothetical protein
LHDITGVSLVTRQPSRQDVGAVEMRQHCFLKPVATTLIGIERHGGIAARVEIVGQWRIFLVEV